MIEKVVTYDHLIDEYGNINVRQITRIMEDGVELSKSYHRTALNPMDALVSDVDDRTRELANMLLNPDTIAAYEAELEEATEEAMEDGIVTEEERVTIWNRIKSYFI